MDLKKVLLIFFVVVYFSTIILIISNPSLLAASISNIEIVEWANHERTDRDIPPLKYNKKLERAAEEKAQDMFKKQYWAHYGPSNETPWQFISETGYQYTFAGENLARGFTDSTLIHEAWMNSQSHRDNILDAAYDEVGVAIVKGKLLGVETYLVVEMFGSETIKTNLARATDYPTVNIEYPKEGDILQSGAFIVHGGANKLSENSVDLFMGESLVEKVPVVEGFYKSSNAEGQVAGDVTINVKARGVSDEYLFDTVKVKVISKQDTGEDYSECVVLSSNAINLRVTYGCSDSSLVKSMKVDVAGIYVTSDNSDPTIAEIPINSVPVVSKSIDVVIYYQDGTSRFVQLEREIPPAQFTSATIGGYLSQINARDLLFVLFGVLLFVTGAFSTYLIRKREFTIHRHQVIAMIGGIIILIVFISKGVISL